MKKYKHIGSIDGEGCSEIIKKDNTYFALTDWNGEKWLNCFEIEEPFFNGYGYNVIAVNDEELTFIPIYRYQNENIDLDELEEDGEEWDEAVEVVDYDIINY